MANKLGLDELNFVDCGANFGTWSLAFVRAYTRATIIALEPSKFAFELLKVNTIGILLSQLKISQLERFLIILNLWERNQDGEV